jgi:prepilin-type N-terminal cleavage/methylation domain-containing protein
MYRKPLATHNTSGFSLMELLVVIIMISVLAAIAAPSWLALMNRQRVGAAKDQALQAMREAQAQAKREKRIWEVSFRQESDDAPVEWSVHRESGEPQWQRLTESNADKISIYQSYTNLSNSQCSSGDYCVQFESKGILAKEWAENQTNWNQEEFGRITFTAVDLGDNGPKRCVVVSTILGSLRTAEGDDCQ